MFPAPGLAAWAQLMPAGILGTFAGVWLHKGSQPRLFYQVCYLVSFLTGCKRLYDGMAGILG